MAKLYLIRHAQSANNVLWDGIDEADGRTSDPEITDLGHRQAEFLGNHFAHPEAEPRQHPFDPVDDIGFGLTHIYCSLMSRSILTAEYISNACNLNLEALPDVFERHGIYDVDANGVKQGIPGQGRGYFEQRFPQLKLPGDMNADGWWNRPAEDEESFQERMRDVVANLKLQLSSSDDCVGLVAHGDFIDQFINVLMDVERHQDNYDNHWVSNWTFHNTSISRIDFTNGAQNVVYLNRIDHLTPELVSW